MSDFQFPGAGMFQVRELEAQRNELLAVIDELTAQRDKVTTALKSAAEHRDKAIAALSNSNAQRDKYLDLINQLTEQRDRYIAVIKDAAALREKQTENYNNLAAQRDGYVGTIKQQAAQRDKLIDDYKALALQRDGLLGDMKSVSAQRDEYLEVIKTLKQQQSTLTGQFEELNGHYTELEGLFKSQEQELARASSQRDGLIKQNAERFVVDETHKAKANGVKLYLDLMEQVLTGVVYLDRPIALHGKKEFSDVDRLRGLDWPQHAFSMIGQARMRNIRTLAEKVIADGIKGDFVETGVWRGGASMMAKAVITAYGDGRRKVYLADSFAGLPPPDVEKYPADKGLNYHEFEQLAVSEEQVKENFRRLGLLDDRVITVKGWFRDTMPSFPVKQIAILRLDGDMYESTIDPLKHLYDKVTPGGWVIVDDYEWIEACKQAVTDYFADRNESPDIHLIDGVGVFFQKPVA